MVERIKDAKPMMDLMAKKVFSNPEITAQFIKENIYHYKRQSKNVQKWEFKNVQFYSLNISFKR